MRVKVDDLLTGISHFDDTTKVSTLDEYEDRLSEYLSTKYPYMDSKHCKHVASFVRGIIPIKGGERVVK